MSDPAARVAEQAKYAVAYARPEYRMHGRREFDAVRDLESLPCRGSYLDVGCGRGEMLRHAGALGFAPVHGIEVVPELVGGTVVLGEAHALPFDDKSVDVATLFDVIEHLLPGDDEAACRELARVARRIVVITANNLPSIQPGGIELHVNKRPYEEWHRLFSSWFAPAKVTWLNWARQHVSQAWRIDL